MKRTARAVAIAAVCLMLSGCLATTSAIIGIGTIAYCAGISEAGKEAIRDVASAGVKVIACEEPVDE